MKTTYLSDIWNWLDGKKTVIGAFLLIVAAHGSLIHLTPEWCNFIADIGTVISGAGIVHKGIKGELTSGEGS